MKGRILVGVQFGALGCLLWLAVSADWTTPRLIVAGVLCVASVLILGYAARDLRSALTVFPEPLQTAPFVTHGIYSVVRHPMYSAVILLAFGLAIVAWTPWAALIALVLVMDLQIKYRYEDALLADKWPSASGYQREVPALIPRIG